MDVFFSDSFIEAFKQSSIETDDVYYPFILLEDGDCLSMSSLGYQGPLFKTEFSGEKALSFMKAKEEYCKENGIVTEFIRYNPYLSNFKYFENFLDIQTAGEFYTIDTALDYDGYLNSRPSRTRSAYAKSSQLEVKFSRDFDSALLAESISMGNDYIADKESAEILVNKGLAVILSAFYKGRESASSLFFVNDESAYYILNASSAEGRSCGANVRLIIEFYRYASKNGIKYIGLGGGIESNDSLALFKKQFATSSSIIRHSKVIHDKDAFGKKNDGSTKYFPSWLKGRLPQKIS